MFAFEIARLPADLVEQICSHLHTRDRVALTSCCRRLWAHPTLAHSSQIWGFFHIDFMHLSEQLIEDSLQYWLARHGVGIRQLVLLNGGAEAMLETLPFPNLQHLAIYENSFLVEEDHDIGEACCWMRKLTHLSSLRLDSCELKALPRCLSSLLHLRELDVHRNWLRLGGTHPSFEPLTALVPLTRLDLSGNSLYRLPAQLTVLTALAELGLGSAQLSGVGKSQFQPLAALGRLTRLDLQDNYDLQALPPQLSALTALACLEVAYSMLSSCASLAARFEALWTCTALTYLGLEGCELPRLPARLTALQHLRQLDFRYNCYDSDEEAELEGELGLGLEQGEGKIHSRRVQGKAEQGEDMPLGRVLGALPHLEQFMLANHNGSLPDRLRQRGVRVNSIGCKVEHLWKPKRSWWHAAPPNQGALVQQ